MAGNCYSSTASNGIRPLLSCNLAPKYSRFPPVGLRLRGGEGEGEEAPPAEKVEENRGYDLDSWKRLYSNTDDTNTILDKFWEDFDKEVRQETDLSITVSVMQRRVFELTSFLILSLAELFTYHVRKPHKTAPYALQQKAKYANNFTCGNQQNMWPQGWSIWFTEYKNNEDYTKKLMASNLIGGWFQVCPIVRMRVLITMLARTSCGSYSPNGRNLPHMLMH
jgi:hypothetical protein